MSTPRSQLVDETITPWYHCVSRCVRRARLCGDNCAHRKDWIVARLRELVEIFAIHCGGFAVMGSLGAWPPVPPVEVRRRRQVVRPAEGEGVVGGAGGVLSLVLIALAHRSSEMCGN